MALYYQKKDQCEHGAAKGVSLTQDRTLSEKQMKAWTCESCEIQFSSLEHAKKHWASNHNACLFKDLSFEVRKRTLDFLESVFYSPEVEAVAERA